MSLRPRKQKDPNYKEEAKPSWYELMADNITVKDPTRAPGLGLFTIDKDSKNHTQRAGASLYQMGIDPYNQQPAKLNKGKNLSQFLAQFPMTPDEATKKEDIKLKEEDKIKKRDIFAKDWKRDLGTNFNEWIRRVFKRQ